jgi:hypothetical protein
MLLFPRTHILALGFARFATFVVPATALMFLGARSTYSFVLGTLQSTSGVDIGEAVVFGLLFALTSWHWMSRDKGV